MKKKILWLAVICLCLFATISYEQVWAKEEFVSLNPVIEVGEKIYVQHDAENNDVYDMYKSGGETTRVYEVLFPNFTAGKAWTIEGEYIDNIATAPHGATAPEDYIPVVEKEQYFIRTYGVGWTEGTINGEKQVVWYAPVLFLDDNDNVISHQLTNTVSKSKAGVFITVPENATKMHLTMFNHQSFALQKVLDLTNEEFDSLPVHRTELKSEISEKYEEYQKDKSIYKQLEKGYITFVNDDTWGAIEDWAELFMEKDIPLVLATIPELLIENATSQTQTRLEVARNVEQAGGEIIAHNAGVLTQEGFSDYNTMYSFFVRTKQMFNYYDFDVNGIILAGGAGQVTGAKESEEWASSLYSYSDLYGVEYDKKEIALDSVYYHRRTALGNYSNNLDRLKQEVDNAIKNKSWLVCYFHNSNEIDPTVFQQLLDYVNSKSETELEVVTYREMYEKNATKESDVINSKHTYYVSSTGTSDLGVVESNPMSYETAQKKTYVSGDTILLKSGDTFYGTFNPQIAKVNDKVTTISSYGEGELPTISGYKIADSEASWQTHGEGLYKIYLMNLENFKGVSVTDTNVNNIGFLEDKKGNKYFRKKSSLSALEEEYDFYCDGNYLYIKTNENPYTKLGELKLATRTNLLILHSNLKVENIRLEGTGAHGMVGSDGTTENVEIANNIIEDIGGSYLNGTTRYGNGIEFYSTNAYNIIVRDNIIRNVYDVGFTMQGVQGSGKKVVVRDNVFASNSQDSEIWQSGSATGIESYEFTNNISVNSGRGWGYDARPEKYASAHILFWQYLLENTDIYFHHNKVYNPRRLYFMEQTNGTNIYFKEKDYIKSDYNNYFLSKDATIFRDSYKIEEKDEFIKEYKKDANSVFSLIEADEKLVNIACTSNDIQEINEVFISRVGDDVILQPLPTRLPTPSPTPTMGAQEIIPEVVLSPKPTQKTEVTEIPNLPGNVTVTPNITNEALLSPMPTEGMKVTVSLVPTEGMEVTVSPMPTKGMEVTVSPVPTKGIEVTASPIPTEGVGITPSAIPTKSMEVTVSPMPTEGIKTTISPAITESVTITKSPETTQKAEVVASPIPTKAGENVTEKPETIPQLTKGPKVTVSPVEKYPLKGTKLTDKKTKAIYVVTKAGKKGGTVTYKKPANKNITAVSIPKTITIDNITYKVTAIAPKAFKNCKKLKKATIKNNVAVIGKEAFSGCNKLKTVTLGAGVTSIGNKAFYKCSALTKITIPSKVKSIGKQAFYGCKKLKTITIKTKGLTQKNVGNKAFQGIHEKAIIKVPKKKVKEYTKLLKA